MANFGLSNSDIEHIIDVIRVHPEIKEVLIFGSRAKGNYKVSSDIDLAIKGDVLEAAILSIKGHLDDEGPLPYKFDIVHYESITNQNLKDHIDQVGIKIYPV